MQHISQNSVRKLTLCICTKLRFVATRLFVSSSNSIQIVRRHCCLDKPPYMLLSLWGHFTEVKASLFYNILIVSCLSAFYSDYCGNFLHSSHLISHIHRTRVKLKWKSSLILYWAWSCEVVRVFTLGAPPKKTFLRKGRA